MSSCPDEIENGMELTLSNIEALDDLSQADDFAICNEIPVDGLETLEEMKERYILHFKKGKRRNRKMKVLHIIILVKTLFGAQTTHNVIGLHFHLLFVIVNSIH